MSAAGEQLAQEFSRFANEADLQDPLKVRRPSHLLPPTAVVAAQLDALQRNDWPDQDAGIRTAFLFAKPQECENMVTGPVSVFHFVSQACSLLSAICSLLIYIWCLQSMPNHVRSWEAKEAWVGFPEFSGMLHSGLYQPLLDSSSWQVCGSVSTCSLAQLMALALPARTNTVCWCLQAASPMLFPSSRMTHKAVQAVHVQRQDSNPVPLAFTFCLERIDTGPYKVHYVHPCGSCPKHGAQPQIALLQGCWLTVGVRVGNYAVD